MKHYHEPGSLRNKKCIVNQYCQSVDPIHNCYMAPTNNHSTHLVTLLQLQHTIPYGSVTPPQCGPESIPCCVWWLLQRSDSLMLSELPLPWQQRITPPYLNIAGQQQTCYHDNHTIATKLLNCIYNQGPHTYSCDFICFCNYINSSCYLSLFCIQEQLGSALYVYHAYFLLTLGGTRGLLYLFGANFVLARTARYIVHILKLRCHFLFYVWIVSASLYSIAKCILLSVATTPPPRCNK